MRNADCEREREIYSWAWAPVQITTERSMMKWLHSLRKIHEIRCDILELEMSMNVNMGRRKLVKHV